MKQKHNAWCHGENQILSLVTPVSKNACFTYVCGWKIKNKQRSGKLQILWKIIRSLEKSTFFWYFFREGKYFINHFLIGPRYVKTKSPTLVFSARSPLIYEPHSLWRRPTFKVGMLLALAFLSYPFMFFKTIFSSNIKDMVSNIFHLLGYFFFILTFILVCQKIGRPSKFWANSVLWTLQTIHMWRYSVWSKVN